MSLTCRLVNENFKMDYVRNLMESRGIKDFDEYIAPDDWKIQSPFMLDNIEIGLKTYYEIVKQGQDILLIVDCDCDGFTSAAIIYQYTKLINPDINIEYRLHKHKQHGLEDHINDIIDNNKKYGLIIIPDAGSNDFEYCEQLKNIAPVLVLDHHLVDKEISDNAIVINNQMSSNYKNKELTGAGVVFQFCRAVDACYGLDYADNFIDIAALGIIGDMGSVLELENRYIIVNGLRNIKNYFLSSLIEKQSYSMNNKVNPTTIAFYIVPLINAMIRVGSMPEKTRLFEAFIDGEKMVESNKRGAKGTLEKLAIESARECTNAKAKQDRITNQMVDILIARAYKYDLFENKVLIIELTDDDDYPSEVNGLAAMKISAETRRPTLILRENDEGYCRGSIRSPSNCPLPSLKKFLESSGCFEWVQGHDNAAGSSIHSTDLKAFHLFANKALENVDFGDNVYNVNFERIAADEDLDDLIRDISQYEDIWGQKNPEALIHIKDLNITKRDVQIIGKNKDTVKIEKFGIVYMKFHAKDFIQELQEYNEITLDIVGRANLNEWMGNYTSQIFIDNYEIRNGQGAF